MPDIEKAAKDVQLYYGHDATPLRGMEIKNLLACLEELRLWRAWRKKLEVCEYPPKGKIVIRIKQEKETYPVKRIYIERSYRAS